MPTSENWQEEIVILDRLAAALDEGPVGDVQKLRASLMSEGVDVEKTLRQGRELFAVFIGREKRKRARKRFERVRQQLHELKGAVELSAADMRDQLATALSGDSSGSRFLAYHRQLASIESEDLESLQEDAALLAFLEQLDEETNEDHE